jgi:hypothetical protein
MNSLSEIVAAWPTTVIRSRLLHASTRKTQKPFSSLMEGHALDEPSEDFRAAVDQISKFLCICMGMSIRWRRGALSASSQYHPLTQGWR